MGRNFTFMFVGVLIGFALSNTLRKQNDDSSRSHDQSLEDKISSKLKKLEKQLIDGRGSRS
ncbi:MAG: hypothetical protein JNM34_11720 [Chthonomonadaceae bacterium]|nr:hypothetical protein [Chthonomonadaceae bacterium]